MTDKNTNPNDAYYWMTQKINYDEDTGYILTPEEKEEMRKRGRAIMKAILEQEPEFLVEIERREKERRERENRDGRQ
jgi:hypothetical protein